MTVDDDQSDDDHPPEPFHSCHYHAIPQTATAIADVALPEVWHAISSDPRQQELLKAMKSVHARYATGDDGRGKPGYEVTPTDVPGQYVCITSSQRHTSRNFQSGSWISRWTIPAAGDDEAGTLQGAAAVFTHFYEGGNMQCTADKEWTLELPAGKLANATAVIQASAAAESAWLTALKECWDHVGVDALKALRRGQSLAGAAFSWNVHHHRNRAMLRASP